MLSIPSNPTANFYWLVPEITKVTKSGVGCFRGWNITENNVIMEAMKSAQIGFLVPGKPQIGSRNRPSFSLSTPWVIEHSSNNNMHISCGFLSHHIYIFAVRLCMTQSMLICDGLFYLGFVLFSVFFIISVCVCVCACLGWWHNMSTKK